MAEPYDYFFKILLLGNSGVGKSGVLRRFCPPLGVPAIGLQWLGEKIIELDGKKINLRIWSAGIR